VRRPVVLAIVALVLGAGCASSNERPEGVVEQWLLSLNQGAAGDPGRHGGSAAERAAAEVLPDWRTSDPGSLDRIQVGGDVVEGQAFGEPDDVPFRIETTDGHEISGIVHVARCGEGAGWCVNGASSGGVEISPGWTWPAGAGSTAWAWAGLTAVVLTVLAVGLVLGVRRSTRPTAPARGT